MKSTIFDIFHPAVAASYFLLVLSCVMALFHPALLALSFIAGLAYSSFPRGAGAALRSLAWQIPLLAIIALLNPLFSGSGSTELFRIGDAAFYAESLAYGACMGTMLISMLLWMSCASQIITSDKLMALTGGIMPTIGLMLSLAGRLVPQFLRQGDAIANAQLACTSARPKRAEKDATNARASRAAGSRLRQITVLMSWSMENSLEASDSMLARGWGAAEKRTTYARTTFRLADALAISLFILLAGATVVLSVTAGAEFAFYPVIRNMLPWWACIPFILLLVLPLAAEAARSLPWNN